MGLSRFPSRGSHFTARFSEMQFWSPNILNHAMLSRIHQEGNWDPAASYAQLKISLHYDWSMVNGQSRRQLAVNMGSSKSWQCQDWESSRCCHPFLTNVNSEHCTCVAGPSSYCWNVLSSMHIRTSSKFLIAVCSCTISRLPCLQWTSTTICFLIWSTCRREGLSIR